MYLQSHIYKNIPVTFNFITTWNQGVFLCSPYILNKSSFLGFYCRHICLSVRPSAWYNLAASGGSSTEFDILISFESRSQWPRGLRRMSSAARLLRLWVRIPPRAWMFVCCECCVLSGRGLCDGLIICSEESYRLWRVVVCDQETSQARRLKPTRGLQNTTPNGGCSAKREKKKYLSKISRWNQSFIKI